MKDQDQGQRRQYTLRVYQDHHDSPRQRRDQTTLRLFSLESSLQPSSSLRVADRNFAQDPRFSFDLTFWKQFRFILFQAMFVINV